jgi:hypothetical protein
MLKLPKGVEALYKIRHLETGKYSTGSSEPEFTKRGKTFGTYGSVIAHFKTISRHNPNYLFEYLSSIEIVTFLIKEYQTEQMTIATLEGL